MKTLILTFALISSAVSFGQEAVNETKSEMKSNHSMKKRAEKNVKTNGKISTSGCETATGKTLAENDFGYADCVKQIGLKK
jgi:hypothetical protein